MTVTGQLMSNQTQSLSVFRMCVCVCVCVCVRVCVHLCVCVSLQPVHCSGAAASKQCILLSYDCSSLQVLIQLILRELHILRPVLQQVSCVCMHACARVHVCAVNICLCGFQCQCVCVIVHLWFVCETSLCKHDLVFSSFKEVVTHQTQERKGALSIRLILPWLCSWSFTIIKHSQYSYNTQSRIVQRKERHPVSNNRDGGRSTLVHSSAHVVKFVPMMCLGPELS